MAPLTAPRITLLSASLMALLAVIWGSSFFFNEIALREVSALTIVLHRVAWAAPVLGLIVVLSGHRLPRGWHAWSRYAVMGLVNNAVPFSLIVWGQTRIESGLASILNGTTAIFAALAAGLFLRDEPLTANRLGGAAIGLLGVALIVGPGALTGLDPRDLGQLAVLGAALCYALAGVWGRRALPEAAPIVNAFGTVAASAAIMAVAALAIDGPPALDLAPATWGALLSLALFSTAFAYLVYFLIMHMAGVANLALVTLLIPPVAITLGAVFLGEVLPLTAWAGFATIAAGLAVTDGRLFRAVRMRG